MEPPVPPARRVGPDDKSEIVAVKFRPCVSKLDDGSTDLIERNYVVKIRVEVEGITVQKFIEELGKTVPWGSRQEVELCMYGATYNLERITTSSQLVAAIEEGRTDEEDADDPEVTIWAELIEAREDSVVGFVPSKAGEAFNDRAFLAKSVPIRNVEDYQIPAAANLNGATGQATSVDWSTIDVDLPNDFDNSIYDEKEVFKMYGIAVDPDLDAEELPSQPTGPPPPPAGGTGPNGPGPTNAELAAVERLCKEAANDVDDENAEEQIYKYDPEHPVFEVGKCWPSMKELKMCFKTFCVNNEFATRTAWTDPNRYCVKCKGVDGNMLPCPWYMSARRLQDGTAIRVNTMPFKHTCMTNARRITRMASQAWVAEKVMKVLSTKPNTTTKRLKIDLEKDYKCTLSYSTVWKGKQRAMKELYGDWGNTFRMLYNFKAEMEKRSPGSIVEIDTVVKDGKVYFSRFFMAMKPCVDGFKEGCRPYLSVDSTALTGKWNGQLPSAIALDGANWMFPVAVGLFEKETEADWTWFLTQLHRALGPMQPLAICTDAQKGLENAVMMVFPDAERRECFGHMWLNLIKKFKGQIFGRMWPAARSYSYNTHKYHLDKMVAAEPKFGDYLRTYHSLIWYRSGFNTEIKVDHINNHLAECFNNWIRHIKDLPVHELMDTLRIKIMNLFNKRRTLSNMWHGDKIPPVVQQVVCRSRKLGHLHVMNASYNTAEVLDTENKRRHIVKLDLHECTCLEWQATGKPCGHAVVVLAGRTTLMMGEFLHEYYSIERFRAAYAGVIEPFTDQSQWPEQDLGFEFSPPVITRKAGRPKHKRFKSFLERGGKPGTKGQMQGGKKGEESPAVETGLTKTGRPKHQHRCKRCFKLEHRAGSYKCVMSGPPPKRLRGEPRAQQKREKDLKKAFLKDLINKTEVAEDDSSDAEWACAESSEEESSEEDISEEESSEEETEVEVSAEDGPAACAEDTPAAEDAPAAEDYDWPEDAPAACAEDYDWPEDVAPEVQAPAAAAAPEVQAAAAPFLGGGGGGRKRIPKKPVTLEELPKKKRAPVVQKKRAPAVAPGEKKKIAKPAVAPGEKKKRAKLKSLSDL